MNAVAMLERCSQHQRGEDVSVGGWGNDGSHPSTVPEYAGPSDVGVEGHIGLAWESAP